MIAAHFQNAPKYWLFESSGALRPAVEAFLHGRDLTEPQIVLLRAYVRQWIDSPVWDRNPAASPDSVERLVQLRADVAAIATREALKAWRLRAIAEGIDPF